MRGVDDEDHGAGSLIIRLLTPRYSTQTRSAASLLTFSTLHRALRRRAPEESTFGSRFSSRTLERETLNLRKIERQTGREDHVGFVCAERELCRRGFEVCVEKEQVGGAED